MSEKSKIQKFIATEIRPKLTALQQDHDKQLPNMKGIAQKLLEAAGGTNPETIKLYLKILKTEVVFAGELVVRAKKLSEALDKLVPDQEFYDDFKEIEQVTKTLGVLREKLKGNFAKLKGFEDQANDALKKLAGSGRGFAEEWAVMEDLIGKFAANARWRLDQTNQFVTKAAKAVADRNQPELDKLVGFAAQFCEGKPPVVQADVVQQFTKFCAKSKASNLDQNARDQLVRELPALKKTLDDAVALDGRNAKNYLDIKAMAIKPVDYRKAASLLKIPESELKKALVLDGSVRENALDTLGKKLKPPTTGKDMVAKLKSAKVI